MTNLDTFVRYQANQMKAYFIFFLLVLFSALNTLSAQNTKRGDSVIFLQKLVDSISGGHTVVKNLDSLCQIIGSHYLKTGKDSIAARYLLKVRNPGQRTFNELGAAFSRIRRREDSAFLFYRRAADANVVNEGRKNAEYAITAKNLGDQFVSRRNTDSGLVYYQQAVMQLVDDFNEDDVRLNPYEFRNDSLPVAQLFDVLWLKAKTLVKRYNEDGKANDLVAAVSTYTVLLRLAPDSSGTVGIEPVDVSVKLFELTGDDVFLRHAVAFATRIDDVKKLQSNIPNDNAVMAYEAGDTTLIGLFLAKNKILHSRISIDSTFQAGKSSRDELYKKLIHPFEKNIADKHKLFIFRDQKLFDVKFENLVEKSKSFSYTFDGTFEKHTTYSFIIWIMIAVVIVLAVLVIRKIK